MLLRWLIFQPSSAFISSVLFSVTGRFLHRVSVTALTLPHSFVIPEGDLLLPFARRTPVHHGAPRHPTPWPTHNNPNPTQTGNPYRFTIAHASATSNVPTTVIAASTTCKDSLSVCDMRAQPVNPSMTVRILFLLRVSNLTPVRYTQHLPCQAPRPSHIGQAAPNQKGHTSPTTNRFSVHRPRDKAPSVSGTEQNDPCPFMTALSS
jgi:hypothetical protein